MHIEELLEKYDLDPEIFDPRKHNDKNKSKKDSEEAATTESELLGGFDISH